MIQYKGWDVHAYTPQMKEVVKEIQLVDKLSPIVHEQMIQEIKGKYTSKPQALIAISKMNSRYSAEIQGYIDPDIGINVSALLHLTWRRVKEINDDSLYNAFAETCAEIGNTCIQGDSHRLLFFCMALMD